MRGASSLFWDYSPHDDYRRFALSPLYSGYTKRGGHMTVSQLILLQCLTIAAGYDLRERRIPHALIYTYLCSGYFLSYRGTLTLPACFFCSSGRAVSYLLRQRRGRSLSSSVCSFARHVSYPGLTDPCRWWRRTTDGTGHRVVRCRCRMSASAARARVGTDVSSMDQNRFRQVEAPGAAHASDTSSGPATASRCDSGTDLLSRVVRFISLPLNPEPAKREILSES